MEAPARYTGLLGCRIPVQQAPMGALSTTSLALAVADAGAVGTLSGFGMPPGALHDRLRVAASRTSGVLAVNFMTADIDPEAVAAAAELVRLVDFFWADPDASLVEIAHRAGALASWQVGSVAEAKAAVDAGCDVVVVQGTEAGGHVRGETALQPLLEQTLGAVPVPVVAAGGIADRSSFAAALAAGAAGARVGTRFVATDESGAHPAYKAALVAAGAGSTQITDAFADCPLCATVPRARVLRSCIEKRYEVTDDIVGEGSMGPGRFAVPRGHGLPPAADTTGRIEAMAMYAGESVSAVHAIVPAGEVVHDLAAALPTTAH